MGKVVGIVALVGQLGGDGSTTREINVGYNDPNWGARREGSRVGWG